MKYNRLTKRIADDEEAFLFHSSLHEAIERLAKLEDKIESGKLISVLQEEQNEREIEFFCKHNDIVRKDTVQQVLIEIGKVINSMPWSNVNYDISIFLLDTIEDIAKKYEITLFENSEQLTYIDSDGEEFEYHIESEDGDYAVIELSDGRRLRVSKEELK